MIRYLRIRNIAVVETLDVEFFPGLVVITGETGSGKSIVVDAVGLLLGGRASSDMIRTGASKAVVEGVFELPEEGVPIALLEEQGIDWDVEGLVIRREVTAAGSGRSIVNGSPVNAAFLRKLGEHLVEIHGQNDTRLLLQPRYHLELLDESHGRKDLTGRVGELAARIAALEEELAGIERDEHGRLQRLDLLEYQIREITETAPVAGEDQRLQEERAVAVHAETLQRAAVEGVEMLFEAEDSVTGVINRVLRPIEEAASLDRRLETVAEALRSALYQVEDVAGRLRDYAGGIEYNSDRLDEIESRLAALDRLKRKYGPVLENVLLHLEWAVEERGRLTGSDIRRESIARELTALRKDYAEVAGDLAKVRRMAAAGVEIGVQAHLADLAMGRTIFEVEFRPAGDAVSCPAVGLDEVEFLVSPNPGEEPRPLRRIASGGEMSRIALALKLVLHAERGAALVFDEVDAGVGGPTAAKLGRKLHEASRFNQTFCVTHVPQIAACADHHFLVEKVTQAERTTAGIRLLPEPDRVEEIARMLGGETLTDASRDAARQLRNDSAIPATDTRRRKAHRTTGS